MWFENHTDKLSTYSNSATNSLLVRSGPKYHYYNQKHSFSKRWKQNWSQYCNWMLQVFFRFARPSTIKPKQGRLKTLDFGLVLKVIETNSMSIRFVQHLTVQCGLSMLWLQQKHTELPNCGLTLAKYCKTFDPIPLYIWGGWSPSVVGNVLDYDVRVQTAVALLR